MSDRRELVRRIGWGRVAFERRIAERRLLPGNLSRHPAMRGAETATLLLIGIAALETLVGFALWLNWLPGALLLHLPLCLATLLIRRIDPPPALWPGAVLRLTVAVLPVLGPLAAAGAMAALLLGQPKGLRSAGGAEPDDPLDARLEAIAGASALPDGLLLESLGDVLRWGHARQKARAIELAAEPGRPGGEALLRLALSDADPGVRAQAELQRPAVERRLLARAEQLRAAARGKSGAAGRAVQRALARQLDRAAYSGLLEQPRANACHAEAAGLWQSLGEAEPDDAEAEAALGRVLLTLGNLPAAQMALESALARDAGPETRGAVPTAVVTGWLAECLFRARDYAALEALVLRSRPLLEAEAEGGGPHAAAWRLWLSEGRA